MGLNILQKIESSEPQKKITETKKTTPKTTKTIVDNVVMENSETSAEPITSINKKIEKKKKLPESRDKNNKKFEPRNQIWLSVSEASKIGGIQTKTIRRAIQSNKLKYKIIKNRYLLDLTSVLDYLNSNKKLQNKLNQNGIGQFIEQWRV